MIIYYEFDFMPRLRTRISEFGLMHMLLLLLYDCQVCISENPLLMSMSIADARALTRLVKFEHEAT